LFDDTTAHHSDNNSTVVTEAEPITAEQQQPEQSASEQPQAHAHAAEDKAAGTEDFASALETFTTEAEEAVSEDRVIKGTVLKLTSTHVVVDIGAKSEGMLPLSEVLDHEGKPKIPAGRRNRRHAQQGRGGRGLH
jgi:small subunit ribosomal protein S1